MKIWRIYFTEIFLLLYQKTADVYENLRANDLTMVIVEFLQNRYNIKIKNANLTTVMNVKLIRFIYIKNNSNLREIIF